MFEVWNKLDLVAPEEREALAAQAANRAQVFPISAVTGEGVPALLDALGLRQPVLVGHSDGATIALLHAASHPVTATVVMAPHVFVEDVAIQAITAAREAFGSGLRERLARHHADVESAFWQWNDVWLSAAFRSFDIRPACGRIGSPLMLVQGLQDEYGTLEQLRAIEQRVHPGA